MSSFKKIICSVFMLLPINATAIPATTDTESATNTPGTASTPAKTADSVTTNDYLLNRLPVCLADFIPG